MGEQEGVNESPRTPDYDVDPQSGAEGAFRERVRRRGVGLLDRLERFLDRHLQSAGTEWAAACHLLPLVAYSAPIPGLGALIAWWVWRRKRDTEPGVAAHGREALDMQLNLAVLSLPALLVFPLWIALNATAIFFALVGALRAVNGRSWRYPWIVRVVD